MGDPLNFSCFSALNLLILVVCVFLGGGCIFFFTVFELGFCLRFCLLQRKLREREENETLHFVLYVVLGLNPSLYLSEKKEISHFPREVCEPYSVGILFLLMFKASILTKKSCESFT